MAEGGGSSSSSMPLFETSRDAQPEPAKENPPQLPSIRDDSVLGNTSLAATSSNVRIQRDKRFEKSRFGLLAEPS